MEGQRRYRATYLRAVLEDINGFIDVAEQLQQGEADAALRLEVAIAAGRAAYTAEVADYMIMEDIPGRGRIRYNPISAWDKQIDPYEDQLGLAIQSGYHIRGTVEQMLEEAQREERSLVGRVASLVGFAASVRRYLADRGYSVSAQRAVTVTVVFGQLLIGIAASLIAVWLGGVVFS